jgi:hypothetical protein
MHLVECPTCLNRVKVDFVPVAGLVWCPTCQNTFAPPASLAMKNQAPTRDADSEPSATKKQLE